MGFTSAGTPRRPGPAVRLTLFPVLNSFFLLANWLLGMFFYRYEENRPLAYILWIFGLLTSALFLVVLYLIVNLP